MKQMTKTERAIVEKVLDLLKLSQHKSPKLAPYNRLATGLCLFISSLPLSLLTQVEKDTFMNWLFKNVPDGANPSDWWWPLGQHQPRIKFLETKLGR